MEMQQIQIVVQIPVNSQVAEMDMYNYENLVMMGLQIVIQEHVQQAASFQDVETDFCKPEKHVMMEMMSIMMDVQIVADCQAVEMEYSRHEKHVMMEMMSIMMDVQIVVNYQAVEMEYSRHEKNVMMGML